MKFIDVDLHKRTITVCVMGRVSEKRKVLERKRFLCDEPDRIHKFFEQVGQFQVVVEATSSYEWFLLLVEDLADRWVLAHPKKLRIIAESKHKSDKIDARILAEFLILDMLPEAYRPSPRVRQHRVLMRHRRWVQGRITSVKCRLASSCWSSSTGRDSHPQGSDERFQSCQLHLILLSQACLAQWGYRRESGQAGRDLRRLTERRRCLQHICLGTSTGFRPKEQSKKPGLSRLR